MAFTHNGNFLVSGDDSGTVRRRLQGGWFTGSLLNTSSFIVLGGDLGLLRWACCVDSLIHVLCWRYCISSVHFPPLHPQVRYWKTNLELVKSVPAHREAVRMLAFAPSDLKYATGSDDSTIRVGAWPVLNCDLLG